MRNPAVLASALLLLFACSHGQEHYATAPGSGAVTAEGGPTKEIGSAGVEDRVQVVDVRLHVKNDSSVPWTVDPDKQTVRYFGTNTNVKPSYVSWAGQDPTTPVALNVAPGMEGTIDLLYVKPKDSDKAKDFQFQGSVDTNHGPVNTAMAFIRTTTVASR